MKNNFDSSILPYVNAVTEKKPINPIILEVKELTSIADFFIIVSGSSSRQVCALAEHVQKDLKNQKIRPLGIEGMEKGQWILLDYGNVIIHIFYDPIRSFYDLEGLWIDAKRMEI